MEKLGKFLELINIIKTLRAPGGCDWDREQNHSSLIPYLTEETYEVIEAIENNDSESLKEELGDLLLHVLFQAELSSEKKQFDIFDSIDTINKKLVERHPYVFNKNINNENYEKEDWEKSKKKEKKRESVLEGVPKSLPGLLRSRRIQEKAASVGFDWREPAPIISKVYEELDEVKDAIDKRDIKEVADALTDILYVTYGAGHAFGIDLDKCFEEVQSSNMSKLDNNGKPIYNDKGKVMKGPNYFKPDLSKFIK